MKHDGYKPLPQPVKHDYEMGEEIDRRHNQNDPPCRACGQDRNSPTHR